MKFYTILSILFISFMLSACAVLQKSSPLQENKDFYILDTHTVGGKIKFPFGKIKLP